MEATAPTVQVNQVLEAIQGVLSVHTPSRNLAEGQLRTWETESAPGFLSCLLQIAEQVGLVEEPIRLLAVVIAKNVVGSSWRKTLGSREWSRVPAEEKQAVRLAAMNMLLNDPSDRVAVQLSLLLANTARFDFPARAPDMLEQLLVASQWPPTNDPPGPKHLRALKALRHVLNALTTKRFVVEPNRGPGQPGLVLMDLRAAAANIARERALYTQKLQELASPLTQLFLAHSQAFLSLAPYWPQHALAAKAAATCLADRLQLLPQSEQLPERGQELLQAAHGICAALMAGPPAGVAGDANAATSWADLGGKLFERVCRMIISHQDNYPIAFAEFVAPFLQLFVNGALLSADAAAIHRMRPKRRVLLVRFIAKSLLSPFYRSEWTAAPLPPGLTPQLQEQLQASRNKALQAQIALEQLLGSGPDTGPDSGPQRCAMLTEAVIAKYVCLTPEELQEWQDDPESYARSMEVESGPDAETPRPIGVGLLLCMLERGGEPVAKCLLSLAARLQATQGPEAALLREATYRCLGEGFSHVAPHVPFSAWYSSELQPMLSQRLAVFVAGNPPDGVIANVLQARALWLVGVCGGELKPEEWGDAFKLAAAYMGAKDLVVALTAVSSCLAMCAPLLDDQNTVEAAEAAARRATGAAAASGLVAALHLSDNSKGSKGGDLGDDLDPDQQEEQALLTLARNRIATRLAAVSEVATVALQAGFGLLDRLGEVESMVRVLQLVSVMVEVMDSRIQPQLPIIAANLPRVWEAAAQHASMASSTNNSLLSTSSKVDKEPVNTGAVVRLHSALLAVLTHLVGKLKGVALADPQVAGVVFPLLRYATTLGTPESECLVDEAFRLWSCTLSAVAEVPPALCELLPNLAALLERGRDVPQTFPLVEAYMLLGAGQRMIPMLDLIQRAMIKCVHAVETAAIASVTPSDPGTNGTVPQSNGSLLNSLIPGGLGNAGQQGTRAFSSESAAEATAASALADVMLQLSPAEVPNMLAPTFSAIVHFVSRPQLPAIDGDARLANCLEGFLEVLSRVFLVQPSAFAALLNGAVTAGPPGQAIENADADALTATFVDKWLTVASHTYVEETLGVKTMAMLGRYRRRIAVSALYSLMSATVFPRAILASPVHITRVSALAVRVQLDDADFHADQSELDNLDFKGDLAEDRVLARRLQVTRSDPVRALKIHEAVKTLLEGLAAAVGGIDQLISVVASNASPRLAAHVRAALSGDLTALLGAAAAAAGGGIDDDIDAQGGPTEPHALLADLSD